MPKTRQPWASRGATLPDLGIEGVVSADTEFHLGNVSQGFNVEQRIFGTNGWITIYGGEKPEHFNSSCHGGAAFLYLLNHLNQPIAIKDLTQKLQAEGKPWINFPSLRMYLYRIYIALSATRDQPCTERGQVRLERLEKHPVSYVMWLEKPAR